MPNVHCIGTILGMITLNWLSSSSHGWIIYKWNPLQSLTRWLTVIFLITSLLILKLNAFYLKFILWIPTDHPINIIRLVFISLCGSVMVHEVFQRIKDPSYKKMGHQSRIVLSIMVTEMWICVKFGWNTVTKPPPSHVAVGWIIGTFLLVAFTVVKFYLVKPNMTELQKKELQMRDKLTMCESIDPQLFYKSSSIPNLNLQYKTKKRRKKCE